MAKSALLEQYSNIWFDKQDYLDAEQAYYEGKLGQVTCGSSVMGRKNKSKQSATPSAAAPSPTPPPPVNSSEQKTNNKQCSNKPKPEEMKGNNKREQGPKPSPTVISSPTPNIPSGVEEGSNNKAAQTSNSGTKMDGIAKFSGDSPALLHKISSLETENKTFKKDIQNLTALVKKLELRLTSLESNKPSSCSAPKQNGVTPAPSKAAPAKADDDDVDLFGSDSEEENEEAAKIREERLAAYNAKKSKKPVLIAKSNIILDVKPWGDDTDMKEMEKQVRAIQMDGLLWGASKLAPLAYGINKLQISCVVEDDLVSVDALTEAIQDIEEYVQSVDIAAFNKV